MKKPRIADLAPCKRRDFMRWTATILAAPAIPAAVRFAINEELFGEAKAFAVEDSLPTYFIEMNLRDQWDFGHVFVPPGIATNMANLVRGGSGDALSFFFTADQITAAGNNFYLTPDSLMLMPHLDNIAIVETNELCTGAIHGHEAVNAMRSPGRTKSADPGKNPTWMNEPGFGEQGNDYYYSSTPTPAALHNYVQKSIDPDLINGITMKFISRFHTVCHYGAGLPNSELTRIQDVQMLLDTFPATVEQLPLASPEEAAMLATALKRADGGFFGRHGFSEVARAAHDAALSEAEGRWYHTPKVIDLPFTPEEQTYWQSGVPDQVGDILKANIWEQSGWAFKLLSNDIIRTVSLEFDYLDVHDTREEPVMKTMAAQSAIPLTRLIESIKAVPGMWERTVIAVYSADGGRTPSANSYGNEGKNSFILCGGMVKGGYYGDVQVAGNTGTGHTWNYISPDQSGAPTVPVGGDNSGRLNGARTWRTVMKALGVDAEVISQFPDVASVQPLDFMLNV
jgi:hypothetical protein